MSKVGDAGKFALLALDTVFFFPLVFVTARYVMEFEAIRRDVPGPWLFGAVAALFAFACGRLLWFWRTMPLPSFAGWSAAFIAACLIAYIFFFMPVAAEIHRHGL
jgi:hypothetical protein